MEYARIAARHFGTEHHEHYVTPDGTRRGDSARRRALRPAVRQLVGGAGVYLRAHGARAWRRASCSPATAATNCSAATRATPSRRSSRRTGAVPPGVCAERCWNRCSRTALRAPAAASRKAASYVDQASVPMPARIETYNLLTRFGPANGLHAAASSSRSTRRARPHCRRRCTAATASRLRRPHAGVRLALHAGRQRPAEGHAARRGWRASTSAFRCCPTRSSICPLRAGARRQGAWPASCGTSSRSRCADFLPPEIIAKKKHGFGLPVGTWLVTRRRVPGAGARFAASAGRPRPDPARAGR